MVKKLNGATYVAGCMGMMTLALSLAGCGDSSSKAQAGAVTQGLVANATVFADKAPYNGVQDADELFTVTDAITGKYNLTVLTSYGPYRLVTKGGTDLGSGRPAVAMSAPSDAANVTPLTTLVALDTTGTVKEKLKSLGITSYDVDLTKAANTSPAAVAFVKSIEAAIDTLSNAVTDATAKRQIQESFAKNIATQIASSASFTTSVGSSDTTSFTTALQSVINTAATAVVNSPPSTVTFSSSTAVTNILTNLVTSVVTTVGSVAPTGTFNEATVAQAVATTVGNTVQTVTSTVTSGGATADTTKPTVVTTSPADGATSVATSATIVITFSEPILTTTFVPTGGTVTWSSDQKVATFTPTVALVAGTTNNITIPSTVKDLAGNLKGSATVITFTVAAATGTTGTTGGTGGGSAGTGLSF